MASIPHTALHRVRLTGRDGASGATGNLQEVYRINTAGGNPPATCEGMKSTFEVQYAAEYVFPRLSITVNRVLISFTDIGSMNRRKNIKAGREWGEGKEIEMVHLKGRQLVVAFWRSSGQQDITHRSIFGNNLFSRL